MNARLSRPLTVLALSLCAGRVWTPLSAWTAWGQDPRWIIIFELRLPRTILALLVGAALGASGATLQGYTRNPLADPGVLGISSAAGLGAVIGSLALLLSKQGRDTRIPFGPYLALGGIVGMLWGREAVIFWIGRFPG